jgi:hypothetical protein
LTNSIPLTGRARYASKKGYAHYVFRRIHRCADSVPRLSKWYFRFARSDQPVREVQLVIECFEVEHNPGRKQPKPNSING